MASFPKPGVAPTGKTDGGKNGGRNPMKKPKAPGGKQPPMQAGGGAAPAPKRPPVMPAPRPAAPVRSTVMPAPAAPGVGTVGPAPRSNFGYLPWNR